MLQEKLYKDPTFKRGLPIETRDMHTMSKDWLALKEDLVAFHAQLGFLRDAHSQLMGLKTRTPDWDVASIIRATNPFDILGSPADICSRWTTVYRERTDICIQMVSHNF